MYINSIISFRDSWNAVSLKNNEEVEEILSALNDYINGNVIVDEDVSRSSRRYWEKALYDRGWEINERTHFAQDGRRIQIGMMGPTKNGINAQIPFGHMEYLSRWVFQQSTLAIKHDLVKYPILMVPMRDFVRKTDIHTLRRGSFEMYLNQLELITPLSHPFPFLILGYSDEEVEDISITELEVDSFADNNVNSVIDRCIEFPPEYHQAGLDILNYFGTYLREQYPAQEAKIRIEQDDLMVRMIVETESGESETIEKALHEYELIVTGQEKAEKFTNNDKLVLDLRNELRIAQFRLESKQDIIDSQNGRLDKLLNIVGDGLANKNNVSIDFKPQISSTSTINLNADVTQSLGIIAELKEEIPSNSEAYLVLNELEGSLEAIETQENPEFVAKSPAMSKFRRFIENVTEGKSDLKKAIDTVEDGWNIFKDLSKRYNKLAEWCGLPQVPNQLVE